MTTALVDASRGKCLALWVLFIFSLTEYVLVSTYYALGTVFSAEGHRTRRG